MSLFNYLSQAPLYMAELPLITTLTLDFWILLNLSKNFWRVLHLVSKFNYSYKENNSLEFCSTLKIVVLVRKIVPRCYFPS